MSYNVFSDELLDEFQMMETFAGETGVKTCIKNCTKSSNCGIFVNFFCNCKAWFNCGGGNDLPTPTSGGGDTLQ